MPVSHSHIDFDLVNGVLHATYRKGVIIDEAAARSIVHARKRFMGALHCPVILFIDGIEKITAGARRYLSSDEAIEGLEAVAMVSRSTLQYVLGNFLLQVNKARIPVRIFHQQSRAEKWIRQFQ